MLIMVADVVRLKFCFKSYHVSAFLFVHLGAVQFVLSLLEPDPVKRPSVKAALEEGWLNEGYTKRPLHTVVYKNR